MSLALAVFRNFSELSAIPNSCQELFTAFWELCRICIAFWSTNSPKSLERFMSFRRDIKAVSNFSSFLPFLGRFLRNFSKQQLSGTFYVSKFHNSFQALQRFISVYCDTLHNCFTGKIFKKIGVTIWMNNTFRYIEKDTNLNIVVQAK